MTELTEDQQDMINRVLTEAQIAQAQVGELTPDQILELQGLVQSQGWWNDEVSETEDAS